MYTIIKGFAELLERLLVSKIINWIFFMITYKFLNIVEDRKL